MRVNKTGEVETVNILAYSPLDVFNESVLRSLPRTQYESFDPLQAGGEKICVQLEVTFCLDGIRDGDLRSRYCDARRERKTTR
jgi:hypothetical protein